MLPRLHIPLHTYQKHLSMTVNDRLMQLKDGNAFSRLPESTSHPSPQCSKSTAQSAVNFGPQLGVDGTMPRLDIRKKALEDVVARSQAKDGLGRLQGKVGVITGVGPEMGIGVCSRHLIVATTELTRHYLDRDSQALRSRRYEVDSWSCID